MNLIYKSSQNQWGKTNTASPLCLWEVFIMCFAANGTIIKKPMINAIKRNQKAA